MAKIKHLIRHKALFVAAVILGLIWPAASLAQTAETRPPKGPAIWRIADDDTELFLFGTVHILPPDIHWQRDVVINALNTADIVYFETTDRDNNGGTYFEFLKAGMAGPGESVHEVLSETDFNNLASALEEIGLHIDSFKGQQPWFASLMMSVAVLETQGQYSEYGVESWMEARLADDRDVRSLENGTHVATALSEMSMEAQIDMLMDGLRDTGEEEEALWPTIDSSLKAWQKGRDDMVYETVILDMETVMPEVYDVLFTRRNADWVIKLDRLMTEETGRIFVAVGSGHLAGPDSVQALLEAEGWTVEQF